MMALALWVLASNVSLLEQYVPFLHEQLAHTVEHCGSTRHAKHGNHRSHGNHSHSDETPDAHSHNPLVLAAVSNVMRVPEPESCLTNAQTQNLFNLQSESCDSVAILKILHKPPPNVVGARGDSGHIDFPIQANAPPRLV